LFIIWPNEARKLAVIGHPAIVTIDSQSCGAARTTDMKHAISANDLVSEISIVYNCKDDRKSIKNGGDCTEVALVVRLYGFITPRSTVAVRSHVMSLMYEITTICNRRAYVLHLLLLRGGASRPPLDIG
jgi:hypothetical protein